MSTVEYKQKWDTFSVHLLLIVKKIQAIPNTVCHRMTLESTLDL